LTARVYEGMFLLDSNRYARDAAGTSRKVGEMIEKCGGEILVSRLWAEQKLAYPINGNKKGAYWLTYFRLDTARQEELKLATRLNTDVLRSLVVKLDDRLVDAMVEHAKSGVGPTPPQDPNLRPTRPARSRLDEIEDEIPEGLSAVDDIDEEE
jgi:small subunit ribosomal protein S6